MVLIAHGHYTIDIIIAYYVTTRLFWTYHTLANNTQLLKVGATISIFFFLAITTTCLDKGQGVFQSYHVCVRVHIIIVIYLYF